jgi:hypothetical protein
MENEEASQSQIKEAENRMRAHLKKRGASLRGLRRLYLFVDEGQSPVLFNEQEPRSRDFVGTDFEALRRLEEYHRPRMDAVRAAFPAVENQLREVGITLLSKEEWLKTPGRPRLVLTLDLGKPKKGASFSARLRVEQEIQLVRDPNVKVTMTTWENGSMKRKFKDDGVTEVFNSLLFYFLRFYRIANDLEDGRDQLNLR